MQPSTSSSTGNDDDDSSGAASDSSWELHTNHKRSKTSLSSLSSLNFRRATPPTSGLVVPASENFFYVLNPTVSTDAKKTQLKSVTTTHPQAKAPKPTKTKETVVNRGDAISQYELKQAKAMPMRDVRPPTVISISDTTEIPIMSGRMREDKSAKKAKQTKAKTASKDINELKPVEQLAAVTHTANEKKEQNEEQAVSVEQPKVAPASEEKQTTVEVGQQPNEVTLDNTPEKTHKNHKICGSIENTGAIAMPRTIGGSDGAGISAHCVSKEVVQGPGTLLVTVHFRPKPSSSSFTISTVASSEMGRGATAKNILDALLTYGTASVLKFILTRRVPEPTKSCALAFISIMVSKPSASVFGIIFPFQAHVGPNIVLVRRARMSKSTIKDTKIKTQTRRASLGNLRTPEIRDTAGLASASAIADVVASEVNLHITKLLGFGDRRPSRTSVPSHIRL